MSKKLKLEDLKLESFITELDNSSSSEIKGGLADTYHHCDNTGKTLDCSGWLCDSTDVSQQSECESCGLECGSGGGTTVCSAECQDEILQA